MKESQATVSHYFDTLSAKWEMRYDRSHFFAQRKMAFAQAIERYRDLAGSALDYGCGSGVLTHLLVGNFFRIVATDISIGMQQIAKSKYSSVSSVSVLAPAELEKKRAFDLVLCSSVIEYVENPDEFLQHLHAYLKPGGVLLLSAPNRAGVMQLTHRILALMRNDSYIIYQKHRFARHILHDLLQRNGFHIESMSGPVGLALARSIGMEELIFCVARCR